MSEPTYTLREAEAVLREQLHAKLDDGAHCGVCLQYAKRYRRPLTSAMAYALVIVSRAQMRSQDEFVHVENLLKNTPGIPSSLRGDFAKLVHWGLVAPAWGKRTDGSKRNGFYKVTPAGYDWVHGRIAIPSHVVIYNNRREGHEGEPIDIRGALGKQFDYNEIMHDQQLPPGPKPAPQPQRLFDTAGLEPKRSKNYAG